LKRFDLQDIIDNKDYRVTSRLFVGILKIRKDTYAKN